MNAERLLCLCSFLFPHIELFLIRSKALSLWCLCEMPINGVKLNNTETYPKYQQMKWVEKNSHITTPPKKLLKIRQTCIHVLKRLSQAQGGVRYYNIQSKNSYYIKMAEHNFRCSIPVFLALFLGFIESSVLPVIVSGFRFKYSQMLTC